MVLNLYETKAVTICDLVPPPPPSTLTEANTLYTDGHTNRQACSSIPPKHLFCWGIMTKFYNSLSWNELLTTNTKWGSNNGIHL